MAKWNGGSGIKGKTREKGKTRKKVKPAEIKYFL
jgi:hypothetical protein